MNTPDDKAFMDGLAGRPGGPGEDHAEGRSLRAALLADDASGSPAAQPDWEGVLRALPANQSRFRPRVWASALAAGLAVCALALWQWDLRGPGSREPEVMRGTASVAEAHWLSAQPQQDAQALAADLRAAGAQVTLTTADDGSAVLDIVAGAAHKEAVNVRLAAYETALDSQGRLRLIVAHRR